MPIYNLNTRLNSLFYFFIFLLCCLCFYGCGTTDVTIDKETIYQNQTAPFIPSTYLIGPGDELRVLLYYGQYKSSQKYIINIEDVLRIEFYHYPDLTREVRVRPDGFITLPLVGEVKAAGKTSNQLTADLVHLYKPHLKLPNITVDVVSFNVKLNELNSTLTTELKGKYRLLTVRPDGMVSFPYIGEMKVYGLTPPEFAKELETKLSKYIENVDASVEVLQATSNLIYVMGAVQKANYYNLVGPTTLTQGIAMAGGFTGEANTHQVVLITRDKAEHPKANVLDMDNILGKGDIGADVLLKQYDVIFVPRTKMAQAALVGDSIWRLIPVRFGAGLYYRLGSE
jgi:protein involved in polysaccharide export with SLBB domain